MKSTCAGAHRRSLRERFPGKLWLDVLSKADLLEEEFDAADDLDAAEALAAAEAAAGADSPAGSPQSEGGASPATATRPQSLRRPLTLITLNPSLRLGRSSQAHDD